MQLLPALLVLVFAGSASAEEGTWGGKWDDQWTVFVTIAKDAKGGGDAYSVTYLHRENEGGDLSESVIPATEEGGYVKAGTLSIKTSGATGLLYGSFKNPRMANLVRIDPEPTDYTGVDLAKYGWKAGAIPAAEAKKLIEGSKASEQ